MVRRFRPTFESLERREVFSVNPIASAPAPVVEPAPVPAAYSLPYLEQENLRGGETNQQQIIAILIGLRQ